MGREGVSEFDAASERRRGLPGACHAAVACAGDDLFGTGRLVSVGEEKAI